MPYVTHRYERLKLYEEVWAEAVTIVAKRYDISDVALRKICKKLAVPVPPLGYWAKVAAGRKPLLRHFPNIPARLRSSGSDTSTMNPLSLIRSILSQDASSKPGPRIGLSFPKHWTCRMR